MKRLPLRLSTAAMLLVGASVLQSATIKEVAESTMANNPKIMSILKNNEAFRLYIDEAKGGYYPKIDLTTYLGTKRTETNPDRGNDVTSKTDGGNAQLDLEQLIFDGGLTSGQVDEAQSRYQSNKFLNDSIIDDIIFDSIDSYLNLVKYKNRLAIGKESISIYSDYYTLAKETEEISGEALHKSQVNAKIHYANNKIFQDKNNYLRAKSSFKKNVGMEEDGKSCRPNLDASLVPSSLKELIDLALVKNPLILEQVENIKEQRAILNQSDANFYPTIKFKAQAVYDNDLITEAEKTEVYSARIELVYNLFNGNKDKVASQREQVFLQESQKQLDTVTTEVVDEITAAYNTYMFSKKRELELVKYIQDNKEILGFYKDQFEGGTRTFIDVLNIDRDLVSAKEELTDIQYDLDLAYFEIFKNLGNVKEAILNSNNQACTEVKKMPMKKKLKKEVSSEELQSLLEEPSVNKNSEEMKVGTYAVYFVAHKDLEKTQKAIENMKEVVGSEYQIKVEPARGYQSGVIYNLETLAEAKEVKAKAATVYSDSYIRKVR